MKALAFIQGHQTLIQGSPLSAQCLLAMIVRVPVSSTRCGFSARATTKTGIAMSVFPCYRAGKHFGKVLYTNGTDEERGKECKRCKRRDYVFNPDHDALLDAVGAKGWTYHVESTSKGDRVRINKQVGDSHPGLCYFVEGLRGTHATKLAVCRALEGSDHATSESV